MKEFEESALFASESSFSSSESLSRLMSVASSDSLSRKNGFGDAFFEDAKDVEVWVDATSVYPKSLATTEYLPRRGVNMPAAIFGWFLTKVLVTSFGMS